jgi:hypothetical protein
VIFDMQEYIIMEWTMPNESRICRRSKIVRICRRVRIFNISAYGKERQILFLVVTPLVAHLVTSKDDRPEID